MSADGPHLVGSSDPGTAAAALMDSNVSSAASALRDANVLLIAQEVSSFYEREANPLMGFVMKLGSDPHLAADIVQATFEDALRAWDAINAPRAWIRRVATRKLIRAKDPTRWREDPVQDFADTVRPLLPGQGSHFLRPDAAVEFSDQTRRLIQLLAELPPAQRTVMAWAMDGYAHHEIAAQLHMTLAAVRQNLSRARTALKEKLKGGDGA